MFWFCRYQTNLDRYEEVPSMKIIHISDTHLVAAEEKLHGLQSRKQKKKHLVIILARADSFYPAGVRNKILNMIEQ